MAKVPVLTGASDPRDRTGEAHDGEDLPPCPHSRITARARGVGNHLHLEAEARSYVQDPDHHGDSNREEKAEWHGQTAHSPTRPCGRVREHLSLGEDFGFEPG